MAAARRADPADLATLRAAFSVWAANDVRFQASAEDNALLEEVKPLSKDLSALGAMGLRYSGLPRFRQAGPAGLGVHTDARVDADATPNAEVLLAGTRPVKILLDVLANNKR